MAGASALDQLHRARDCVRQALEQWDPVQLDRMEASRQLLEAAAAAIREVEEGLRGRTVKVTSELRSTLLSLRRDIQQATRVVDACEAFQRGLAARLGVTTTGYNADGGLDTETIRLEPEVHC